MILDEFKLEGNVAILTGAGQSWTRELALALAEAYATVVVATSDQNIIDMLKKERGDFGEKITVSNIDLVNSFQIQRLVDDTVSHFGKVDILVNSLNLEFAKPIVEVSEDEWHRVIDTNLTSMFLCCKAVGKQMLKQKAGKIVNIASSLGEAALVNSTTYCAAMGGVIQLTKALALEWARQNIRVNAIGAGWMYKPELAPDPVINYIPLRRRGQAADLASLMVFLASEASSYMSGHVYLVDGGVMARG